MNNWQLKLKERGILEPAIKLHWQPGSYKGNSGWKYPVFDMNGNRAGVRWKNFDSSGNPKAVWFEGNNTTVPFYCPPGLKEAVAAAGGVLYLAAGEPDLLSYLAAGVDNVLSLSSGEKISIALQETLVSHFNAIGATRVIYIPDKDKAGLQSAYQVQKTLQGSGIEFAALALPGYIPEKGDVNDLWKFAGFNRDAFNSTIEALPAVNFADYADILHTRKKPVKKAHIPLSERSTTKKEAIAAIEYQFENAGKTKRSGQWLNCACPFHDDKHASFGFNTETGAGNCFVCGGFSFVDMCNATGVDYRPDEKARRDNRRNRRATGAGENIIHLFPPDDTPDLPPEMDYAYIKNGQAVYHDKWQINPAAGKAIAQKAIEKAVDYSGCGNIPVVTDDSGLPSLWVKPDGSGGYIPDIAKGFSLNPVDLKWISPLKTAEMLGGINFAHYGGLYQYTPLDTPKPDIRVFLRYISDMGLPLVGCFLINSALGTGKTELAIKAIRYAIRHNLKVLFLSHRVALAGNTMQRLIAAGIISIQDYQQLSGWQRWRAEHLVMVQNSIVSFPDSVPLPEYGLLVIDEIEQQIEHLFSGTYSGNEALIAYDNLTHIIKRAKLVLALDAHAGGLAYDFLRDDCSRDDTQFIVNEYPQQKKPLGRFDSFTALIEHAEQTAANSDLPIIIACGQQGGKKPKRHTAKAIARHFENLYPGQVVVIHSGNSLTAAIRQFLAAINTELPKIKVLIFTSSIGSGVDITCPVSAVYGVFTHNPLTPPEWLQMLGRARNAENYYAWIPVTPPKNPLPETADEIYNLQIARAKKTGELIKQSKTYIQALKSRDANGVMQLELTPLQERYTRLLARAKAQRNHFKNNPLGSFLHLAQGRFDVYSIDKTGSDETGENLKTAGKDVTEKQKELVLSDTTTITPQEWRDKNGRGLLNPDVDTPAVTRDWMLHTTGEITDDAYDFCGGYGEKAPPGFGKMEMFAALFEGLEASIQDDIQELPFALNRRKHRATRWLLISAAIRLLWPMNDIYDMVTGVSEADIERAAGEFLTRYGDDLYTQFPRWRTIENDTPLKLYQRLFRLIGLKFKVIRNSKQAGLYRVPKKVLDTMLRWYQQRKTHQEAAKPQEPPAKAAENTPLEGVARQVVKADSTQFGNKKSILSTKQGRITTGKPPAPVTPAESPAIAHEPPVKPVQEPPAAIAGPGRQEPRRGDRITPDYNRDLTPQDIARIKAQHSRATESAAD